MFSLAMNVRQILSIISIVCGISVLLLLLIRILFKKEIKKEENKNDLNEETQIKTSNDSKPIEMTLDDLKQDSTNDNILDESKEQTEIKEEIEIKHEEELINEEEIKDNKGDQKSVSSDDHVIKKEIKDENTKLVLVRYLSSFRAKVSMGSDELRSYYQRLKSYMLSYKLKSRMSFSLDTIYKGRIVFAKINARKKSLVCNLALNPNDFVSTKYSFKDTSDSKKYEMVPMRIKIKSERGFKYACELVDILAQKMGYEKDEKYIEEDYLEPKRSFEENLELKLIKEVKGKVSSLEEINNNKLKASQDIDYDIEDDELEIDQDIIDMLRDVVMSRRNKGKRAIVNLKSINDAYNPNEIVNLKTLKQHNLISSKVQFVKCLSEGHIEKPLIFELNDYSKKAAKEILYAKGEIR